MRKIAILVPSMAGGGAEKVVTTVVRYLNKELFDVHLILVKAEGPYMDLIPENIHLVDLNVPRVRYAPLKLISVLNKIKPDLIFSTLDELNLALTLIKPYLKHSPKLILREANTPSKVLSTMPSAKKKFTQKLFKHYYSKADLIVAQCKTMKEDIIQTYSLSPEKIIHIYNPLNVTEIRKMAMDYIPYDSTDVNILAVGRLRYQKGFDTLLHAFQMVVKEEPSARLTILGEGEMLEELTQLSQLLGLTDKVDFLGFNQNPYPYYYFADTYVLSSRWEGFPNSLLEALACGTKVVATDCKSGPREILMDNDYGLLVEEENPAALAEGILSSIKGECKSKDRAEEYKVDAIMKNYEDIFLTL